MIPAETPKILLLNVSEIFFPTSVPYTRFRDLLGYVAVEKGNMLGVVFRFPRDFQGAQTLSLYARGSIHDQLLLQIRFCPLPLRVLIGFFITAYLVLFQRVKVVYVREALSGLCVLPLQSLGLIKLVRDVRGLGAEELAFHKGGRTGLKGKVLGGMDRVVMKYAQKLVCVSEEMRAHLQKNYRIDNREILVVPNHCSIRIPSPVELNTLRERERAQRGLQKRFVILFSGGIDAWQCLPESLLLFREILRQRADAFLLLCVRDVEGARRKVSEMDLPAHAVGIECVPQDHMIAPLAISDWGLAIRNPSVVNRVSCPTKVVEYLSAGLPVLLTQHVGGFAKMVVDEGRGYCLPYESLNDEETLKTEVRHFLRASAEIQAPIQSIAAQLELFSRDKVAGTWSQLLAGRDPVTQTTIQIDV